MLQIHPNARTTPVTRAEIAGSPERTGVLAERYGTRDILTLDERHFRALRPLTGAGHFRLLPTDT